MFKSAKFVIEENLHNLYRIFSITRYELLAEMRESKLGLFWNFANPAIQVLTYWFVFGYVFKKDSVHDIPYLVWMLGGIVVWFYISPCITDGCNAIYKKVNVITKMKFPASILPMTVVLKKLFDHLCLLVILFVVFAFYGYYPSMRWFGIIYYLFCAIIFSYSLSLTTSVLNMLARDTRKLILACMRLLLYLTPVLWEIERISGTLVEKIIKCNPIYYIVNGYRECFFGSGSIFIGGPMFVSFWVITIFLFLFGSFMIYKFKTKFIDMI